jgi:hypothetical protein
MVARSTLAGFAVFFLLGLVLQMAHVAEAADASAESVSSLKVAAPPADEVERLKLSGFYKKHVSVEGFPIVSSEKVSDAGLLEAAYIVHRMLEHRPDVLKALIESKTRLAIMAADEMTTVIPEHSDLEPAKYWDRRARGLGATRVRPAVSCGEENLLCLRGDPYAAENILIHEFGHAIHEMGLNHISRDFDRRLRKAYEAAMDKGLWKEKYAANNRMEYWAEGVQSWFDTNRPPDHDHNHVDTREELKEYDPDLAALCAEVFGEEAWRYVRPHERESAPHLNGFDRESAPRFRWPDGLEEWYREYERGKRERR